MDTKVIHVFDKNMFDFVCPHCSKLTKISTKAIPSGGYKCSIKCKCDKITGIQFEKRKSPRKKKSLLAVVLFEGREYFVDLLDMSKTGCMVLNSHDRLKIEINDRAAIRVRLDDAGHELIECTSIAKYAGDIIGFEFVDLTARVKLILDSHFS